jgi:hypothetical protein
MNLTYINVKFTDKLLRCEMYLQDKDFNLYHVAGISLYMMSYRGYVLITYLLHLL